MEKLSLTSIETGLVHPSVRRTFINKRLVSFLKRTKEISYIIYNQITSVFFVLLLVSAVLSYTFGSTKDAWIFFILNFANVIIGFFQEYKASKASKLLEDLIQHKVQVTRDSRTIEIEASEIVTGDIIHFVPGNVTPVDVLLREIDGLMVDKSVLTGESFPVSSSTVNETLEAGVNIVSGTAIGQALNTSDSNSIVKYAKSVEDLNKNNGFITFISSISKNVLLLTLVSLALVCIFAVFMLEKYTFSEYLLYSISMLVGVVPESLPLIITLMLTREALEISKSNVLIKRLSSLQQLGTIKFFLSDKTGTLTENTLHVHDTLEVSNLHRTAEQIAYAEYNRTPLDNTFDIAIKDGFTRDMEIPIAIKEFIPFKSDIGYAAYIFEDETVIIRGQFDSVSNRCAWPDTTSRDSCTAYINMRESAGLRVIALASKTKVDMRFKICGLIAFEDPIKERALDAYKALEGLGISVKILTGDSPRVAQYVARKLDQSLTTDEVLSLESMHSKDISELSDLDIITDKVYARCKPDQKLSLVDRHEQLGATGFLGEGINDALALKRADVGLVVNNASDVARQSADIILTESGFKPVIKCIQMSRKVYAHIFTYLLCTLSGNIGTLISLTTITIFWTDLPMLPIQILLNNLLTDVPLILLITDNLDRGEYKKPVSHNPKSFFRLLFIFGAVSSAFDILYFIIFKDAGISELRTGWFVLSVLCELALVLTLRSKLSIFKAKRMSAYLKIGLMTCALVAVSLPFTRLVGGAFHLVPLSVLMLGVIVGLVILNIIANEIAKKVYIPYWE